MIDKQIKLPEIIFSSHFWLNLYLRISPVSDVLIYKGSDHSIETETVLCQTYVKFFTIENVFNPCKLYLYKNLVQMNVIKKYKTVINFSNWKREKQRG